MVLVWVKIQPRAALPLLLLVADVAFRYSGEPDAEMGGMHHCVGDPVLDIATHLIVVLTPLGGKVEGHTVQRSFRLSAQKDIH